MSVSHLAVIDPAVRIPELECFNFMAQISALPLTYHLPAMHGMGSLEAEDLAAVKGLVILGSSSSVHERAPWQLALEGWLKPRLDRGLPTLGVCYGHQMLAHMYGGKVAYVFEDRTKHLGLRKITLDATDAWPAAQGKICVSHNETVVEAPACMRIAARSAEIAIDGLAHKTLPIISLQSHPEATPEFLKSHAIEDPGPKGYAFGHDLVARFLDFAAKYRR